MRRPPGSTQTDALLPYPTLFLSVAEGVGEEPVGVGPVPHHDPVVAAAVPQQADHRPPRLAPDHGIGPRSVAHTSELQSLMRRPYADFCLSQKQTTRPSPAQSARPETTRHNKIRNDHTTPTQ